MSNKIDTKVPNVYVTDLERLAKKIRQANADDTTEVSFEFIIASLFPTSWENIVSAMNHQYTQGYIQGRKDAIDEQEHSTVCEDDDSDCYCE